MLKVAVFASGKGSNFKNIHRLLSSEYRDRYSVACLVTDKPASGAADYAREQAIPIIEVGYTKGVPRESIETDLLTKLEAYDPVLLVLAGYMRLLSPVLIDRYPRNIINIHPSLLPKYPGTKGIEESYKSSDTILGITIHFVDYGLDTGPIILQKSFERPKDADLETIETRIHALEHETYPDVIVTLLNQRYENTPT